MGNVSRRLLSSASVLLVALALLPQTAGAVPAAMRGRSEKQACNLSRSRAVYAALGQIEQRIAQQHARRRVHSHCAMVLYDNRLPDSRRRHSDP
jgi:hypothetical protein